MNREQAWALLNEYTKNPALVRHALCVEAAMRHYARLAQADEATWGLAGLLHDFDYERWPNPPEHTREGAKILRQHHCPEEVVGAVLAHVPWNLEEYPRDRPIRKTLFAVDEICGFIYAAALVRPERIEGMEPKGVIKKLKQKSFAASVSREDIDEGARSMQTSIDTHIEHCITAIRGIASQIGLEPAK